jgi:hypothetical protein
MKRSSERSPVAQPLEDQQHGLRTLTHVLGPTISPHAFRNPAAKAPCAAKRP